MVIFWNLPPVWFFALRPPLAWTSFSFLGHPAALMVKASWFSRKNLHSFILCHVILFLTETSVQREKNLMFLDSVWDAVPLVIIPQSLPIHLTLCPGAPWWPYICIIPAWSWDDLRVGLKNDNNPLKIRKWKPTWKYFPSGNYFAWQYKNN